MNGKGYAIRLISRSGSRLTPKRPSLQRVFGDASSPAGAANQWLWDFGDSTGSSTSQNPVYTYTMSGYYTVTLTITDTDTGESGSLARAAFIQAISPTIIHYDYDALYRLTEAAYTGAISATYQYHYDAVGNMDAYTETITSTTSVERFFNDANQLTTSVDASGTTTYTYDLKGNLTTIDPPGASGTVRYGYDQRNLMITSTVDGSAVASFAYDGLNNRLRQVDFTGATAITTTYANDILGLSQVLIADDGTDQVVNLFGLDLILQDDGTGALALLADGLGSVRLEMVGEAVESTTTYSPYGKELVQEGDSATVYGYTGEQEDGATGLLYLRARYYSSGLMTFMSKDPWAGDGMRPGTSHGYAYARGDPVNRVDPSGLCDEYLPDEACWAIYEEIVRRYPTALAVFPSLAHLTEAELRLRLDILELVAAQPPPPRNVPIRIPIDNWFGTPLPGDIPIEVILMPPGYVQQPRGRLGGILSTWCSAAGAGIDLLEAGTAFAALPALPEWLSAADAIVALGGSYLAGETGAERPHPSLPPMVFFGQDVLVNAGEAALIYDLKFSLLGAGFVVGNIPGGMTGYVLASEIDGITSLTAFGYDLGRTFKLIPTKTSIGFFLDNRLGYSRPAMAFLLYE